MDVDVGDSASQDATYDTAQNRNENDCEDPMTVGSSQESEANGLDFTDQDSLRLSSQNSITFLQDEEEDFSPSAPPAPIVNSFSSLRLHESSTDDDFESSSQQRRTESLDISADNMNPPPVLIRITNTREEENNTTDANDEDVASEDPTPSRYQINDIPTPTRDKRLHRKKTDHR